jgi:hypothetical protein
MERIKRKPFQGVINIVRFNWHFYIIGALLVVVLIIITPFVPSYIGNIILLFNLLALTGILISLFVSFYIYDRSSLYSLDWLGSLPVSSNAQLVNINAGFDETSLLLSQKFPLNNMRVFDFYDAQKHTEISIERARKAYPVFAGTRPISTSHVPLAPCSIDFIFLLLSAHEIRSTEERVLFFKQLKESLNEKGNIVVVEHLRDWNNLLAYNLGFFHFLSKNEWMYTFRSAELNITSEKKITPFISAFILEKNGITP